MKINSVLRNRVFNDVRKTCFISCLLLAAGLSARAQVVYHYSNVDSIKHFKVIENASGTGSVTASNGIKITSSSSGSFYVGTQYMADTSRNFTNAKDVFPTDASNGKITFKVVQQPAVGNLSVRLGLYSIMNDAAANCGLRAMPTSSGDVRTSYLFSSANSANGTVYTIDLASQAIADQFANAYALAQATYGASAERAEAFQLKFGWASYTGAQSFIVIDSIVYTAPSNLNITPAGCVSGPIILPVVLKNFEAKTLGDNVQLKWTTATEINTAQFVVERSTDGRNFASIGAVHASGNTTAEKAYTFLDYQPATGANWYRLRIEDKDGQHQHTAVKAVNIRSSTSTMQSATIVSGDKAYSISIANFNLTKPATLLITDATGRLLRKLSVNLDNRIITLQPSLAAGTYLVHLQQGSEKIVLKVVE